MEDDDRDAAAPLPPASSVEVDYCQPDEEDALSVDGADALDFEDEAQLDAGTGSHHSSSTLDNA